MLFIASLVHIHTANTFTSNTILQSSVLPSVRTNSNAKIIEKRPNKGYETIKKSPNYPDFETPRSASISKDHQKLGTRKIVNLPKPNIIVKILKNPLKPLDFRHPKIGFYFWTGPINNVTTEKDLKTFKGSLTFMHLK